MFRTTFLPYGVHLCLVPRAGTTEFPACASSKLDDFSLSARIEGQRRGAARVRADMADGLGDWIDIMETGGS